MKTILEKLKRYKWAVLAVGIVALILLVFFIYKYSKKHQQLPVNPAEKITFVKASPPSGLRQTINAFSEVVFEFSQPVDPNSALSFVSVEPNIGLKVEVSPLDGKFLWVIPTNPWEDNTEYRIKISGDLTSVDGVKLGSPIDYLYLNVTPTNIEGGGDY